MTIDVNPCNVLGTMSLESNLRRLALEASVVANVADIFTITLPGFVNALGDSVSSFLAKDDGAIHLAEFDKESNLSSIAVKDMNFAVYGKTMVPVPQSFDGNFLEYLDCLTKMAPALFKEANDTLINYRALISAFATNKDMKSSLKDHTDYYTDVAKHREAMQEQIQSFFSETNTRERAYISQIFFQGRDIPEAVKRARELEKLRLSQDLPAFKKEVDRATDILKLIVKDMESGDTSKVSGPAAVNLSKGAYELAKYIEFVAIYRFRVQQACQAAFNISTTVRQVKTLQAA